MLIRQGISLSEMNNMSPEEYTDFLEAAEIHNIQDILDGISCSEHALSPSGFKNPGQIMSARQKVKQQFHNRRITGLGIEILKAPVQKIESARAALKNIFQKEISKGNKNVV